MRVCVVGAGAAGLCATRHLSAVPGIEPVTYEQAEVIGGTWVYTEAVGNDPKTGLPVHSSMYKSLRTNLPKEVMGFPDFPIPEQEMSYIPAKDILQFLNLYADHFDLRKHINFLHTVSNIEPDSQAGGWMVTARNLKTNKTSTEHFDAVMICNGHYHTPSLPDLEGADSWEGARLHSHDYRTPAPFAGRAVVVIGAGPSGMDLALEIASVAKQVILSHHLPDPILTEFPSNLVQRPDVARVGPGSLVTFQDGTHVQADVLFYCTGYKYSFPFLGASCGVRVEDNQVQPLYKHLVHAHRPTLCFVGLPYYVCAFTMFHVQSAYFVRVLKGELVLPSAEEMLSHTRREAEERKDRGLGARHFHMMGPQQQEYYDCLTEEAGLPRVPPVMSDLHTHSSERFLQDLVHYRQDIFRILDDRTYVTVS